jgi:hypothetical protein
MTELCARIDREFPAPNNAKGASIVPLRQSFVRDLQPKLLAVTAAAAFVMLIAGPTWRACCSCGSCSGRRDDAAGRLGASRARLAGRFVFESLWLTAAGIVVGVLLAAGLTEPLYALSPMASDATGNALREFDHSVRIDVPVLLASAGLALAVGLGASLVAAQRASRLDFELGSKLGARGASLDRGTRRTFGALVVWEIGVAAVLLTATGLVVRSFHNLVREDWGFATENRLVFGVTFSAHLRPEHAQRVGYVERRSRACARCPASNPRRRRRPTS